MSVAITTKICYGSIAILFVLMFGSAWFEHGLIYSSAIVLNLISLAFGALLLSVALQPTPIINCVRMRIAFRGREALPDTQRPDSAIGPNPAGMRSTPVGEQLRHPPLIHGLERAIDYTESGQSTEHVPIASIFRLEFLCLLP